MALSLNYLALLLHGKGDYTAAEPLLVEAADVFERARLRSSTRGGLERVGRRETPIPRLDAAGSPSAKKNGSTRRLR